MNFSASHVWSVLSGGSDAPETLRRFRVLFGGVLLVWFGAFYVQKDLWLGQDAFYGAATQWHYSRNGVAAWLLSPLGSWNVFGASYLYPILLMLGMACSVQLVRASRPWVAALALVVVVQLILSRAPILIYAGDGLFVMLLWLLTASLLCPQRPREARIFVFTIRVQISFVYAWAALSKLAHPGWRSGQTLAEALLLEHYSRFPEIVSYLGPASLLVLAWLACLTELALAVIPWIPRFALPAFIVGCGLHLSLEILFMVVTWQPLMVAALTIFVPSVRWAEAFTRRRVGPV